MRETENRVRLAGQPKARTKRKALDPDAEAALSAAGDQLEKALGHEVTVKPKGEGIAVELRFDDVDEARAFARALGRKRR